MLAEQCIGKTPCCGKQIIEEREDGFLDLAGVVRAADEDEVLLEMEENEHLAARAVGRRVGMQAGADQDRQVRLEASPFRVGRPQQAGTGEQRVPRQLGDDADAKPVAGSAQAQPSATNSSRPCR